MIFEVAYPGMGELRVPDREHPVDDITAVVHRPLRKYVLVSAAHRGQRQAYRGIATLPEHRLRDRVIQYVRADGIHGENHAVVLTSVPLLYIEVVQPQGVRGGPVGQETGLRGEVHIKRLLRVSLRPGQATLFQKLSLHIL